MPPRYQKLSFHGYLLGKIQSVQLTDCSLLVVVVLGGRASRESQHQSGLLPLRPAVPHGPRVCLSAGEKLLQPGENSRNYTSYTRTFRRLHTQHKSGVFLCVIFVMSINVLPFFAFKILQDISQLSFLNLIIFVPFFVLDVSQERVYANVD